MLIEIVGGGGGGSTRNNQNLRIKISETKSYTNTVSRSGYVSKGRTP